MRKTGLLARSGISWAATGFAVRQRRLLRRKRFGCIAAAFPGQQIGFTVRQRRLLRRKQFGRIAAAFPGQQPDLLSGSGGCCAGNRLAVPQRRLLDSNWICRQTTAVAVQETVSLSSSGIS
ncbi:MAG: hypothetical protein DMG11_34295 [Acidobacteria bacterium]|nr:MAG: hypothetical protein DMG11_34295 [Acidobacteriota bacterium]